MNDANRACRAIIEKHSKSFALAARLLPARCRDDAVALYAWCRRADDAVDHPDSTNASGALARLRAELADIYDGKPRPDPILVAFQSVVLGRKIPSMYASELLDGMEMDVHGHDYQTLDDLLLYCHRAAGVVGLMMCHVLGVRDDRALPHAAHLGIAMQLTNICRDVAEDLARGRCYLPAELMGESVRTGLLSMKGGWGEVEGEMGRGGEGVGDRGAGEQGSRGEEVPLSLEVRKAFGVPIRELLALAERYYESADQGMRYLDWQTSMAIRTARSVYSRIGEAIARRQYDVFAGRAYVSKPEKIRLAASAVLKSLSSWPAWRDSRENVRTPVAVLQYPESVALESKVAVASG